MLLGKLLSLTLFLGGVSATSPPLQSSPSSSSTWNVPKRRPNPGAKLSLPPGKHSSAANPSSSSFPAGSMAHPGHDTGSHARRRGKNSIAPPPSSEAGRLERRGLRRSLSWTPLQRQQQQQQAPGLRKPVGRLQRRPRGSGKRQASPLPSSPSHSPIFHMELEKPKKTRQKRNRSASQPLTASESGLPPRHSGQGLEDSSPSSSDDHDEDIFVMELHGHVNVNNNHNSNNGHDGALRRRRNQPLNARRIRGVHRDDNDLNDEGGRSLGSSSSSGSSLDEESLYDSTRDDQGFADSSSDAEGDDHLVVEDMKQRRKRERQRVRRQIRRQYVERRRQQARRRGQKVDF